MMIVEQPLALPAWPAKNKGRNYKKFVIYFQQVCLSVVVVIDQMLVIKYIERSSILKDSFFYNVWQITIRRGLEGLGEG